MAIFKSVLFGVQYLLLFAVIGLARADHEVAAYLVGTVLMALAFVEGGYLAIMDGNGFGVRAMKGVASVFVDPHRDEKEDF